MARRKSTERKQWDLVITAQSSKVVTPTEFSVLTSGAGNEFSARHSASCGCDSKDDGLCCQMDPSLMLLAVGLTQIT